MCFWANEDVVPPCFPQDLSSIPMSFANQRYMKGMFQVLVPNVTMNQHVFWGLDQYGPILVFFLIATVISLVIFGASYLVSVARADVEKISAYECGFDPFEDARTTFDVRFYLVGLLFLLFDLEVAFLFPWSVEVTSLPFESIFSRLVFLGILTVGFVYEWKKGALSLE